MCMIVTPALAAPKVLKFDHVYEPESRLKRTLFVYSQVLQEQPVSSH